MGKRVQWILGITVYPEQSVNGISVVNEYGILTNHLPEIEINSVRSSLKVASWGGGQMLKCLNPYMRNMFSGGI